MFISALGCPAASTAPLPYPGIFDSTFGPRGSAQRLYGHDSQECGHRLGT